MVYLHKSRQEEYAEQQNQLRPFMHSITLSCLKYPEQMDTKEEQKQRSLFQTFSELVFTSR